MTKKLIGLVLVLVTLTSLFAIIPAMANSVTVDFTSLENIAYGKEVTVVDGKLYSSGRESYATDGDINTAVTFSGRQSDLSEIKVDLSEMYNISEISVYSSMFKQVNVYADGIFVETLANYEEQIVNGKTMFVKTIKPESYTNARYITFSYPRKYDSSYSEIYIKGTPSNTNWIPVKELDILAQSPYILVGGSQFIWRTIYPTNATNQRVIWSSKDPSIATVDANGVVTGKRPGVVEIWAYTADGNGADYETLYVQSLPRDYRAPFDNVAYSFENQTEEIPKAVYLDAFGDWVGTIKYYESGEGKNKGVCGGFVASSMLFHYGYRNYSDYGGSNIRDLEFKGKVKKFIWFMNICQEKTLFKDMKNKNGVYHNSDVTTENNIENIEELVETAQKGLVYISIGQNINSEGGSAHAVLSYGVTTEEFYRGMPCTKLWVYDCNFPDESDKYIALYQDSSRNYTGEWEYVGHNYPFDSKQNESRLSFVDADHIRMAAESGNVHLYSLREVATETNITILQDSINATITNDEESKLIIENGFEKENNISGATYSGGYLFDNSSNEFKLPDDKYTINGNNTTGTVSTTIYSSSDCMKLQTSNDTEIEFNIRDLASESMIGDNFVNINNKSMANDYIVTYMPSAEMYGYSYDTISVKGNTDEIVNIYEKEGSLYVTGEDAFEVTAVVGNDTISTTVENLNENSTYHIKFATENGASTIQILEGENSVTGEIQLPGRTQAPLPTYDVASGEYDEGQLLTLTSTNENVSIYYTTDGSTPEANIDMIYTDPIEIDQTMVVKVLATQYGCDNSDILELNYNLPTVLMPSASLNPGEYDTLQEVKLNHATDTEIYYTMDGTNPKDNGILYTTPITIYEDTVVQAYALKNGVASNIAEFEYTINHKYPLYLSDSIISQDGEIITDKNASALTKITLVANKTAESSQDVKIIAAFYDETDAFLKRFYKEFTLAETENILELPVENVSGAKKVKIFAWDTSGNLVSLCDSKECK